MIPHEIEKFVLETRISDGLMTLMELTAIVARSTAVKPNCWAGTWLLMQYAPCTLCFTTFLAAILALVPRHFTCVFFGIF